MQNCQIRVRISSYNHLDSQLWAFDIFLFLGCLTAKMDNKMESRSRRHELVIRQYMVISKFKLNYNYLGIKNVSIYSLAVKPALVLQNYFPNRIIFLLLQSQVFMINE